MAARWFLHHGLYYCDVEEMLAERGMAVDHVTVFRWVQRFIPLFIDAARPCRHSPGDRRFIDKTYVKVAGKQRYLYRAIDQFGQVLASTCRCDETPKRPDPSSPRPWRSPKASPSR